MSIPPFRAISLFFFFYTRPELFTGVFFLSMTNDPVNGRVFFYTQELILKLSTQITQSRCTIHDASRHTNRNRFFFTIRLFQTYETRILYIYNILYTICIMYSYRWLRREKSQSYFSFLFWPQRGNKKKNPAMLDDDIASIIHRRILCDISLSFSQSVRLCVCIFLFPSKSKCGPSAE